MNIQANMLRPDSQGCLLKMKEVPFTSIHNGKVREPCSRDIERLDRGIMFRRLFLLHLLHSLISMTGSCNGRLRSLRLRLNSRSTVPRFWLPSSNISQQYFFELQTRGPVDFFGSSGSAATGAPEKIKTGYDNMILQSSGSTKPQFKILCQSLDLASHPSPADLWSAVRSFKRSCNQLSN